MTTREAYSVLESANFLRDLGGVQPMTPEDMETRRRIIDFVHELETATFMLAMSYKEPFLDLVEEKDFGNKFKTEYFNSIICILHLSGTTTASIWCCSAFGLITSCMLLLN